MSVVVEVTLRWKPEAQGEDDLMVPRGEVKLRRLMIFSSLPRKGDKILYHPDPAEICHLSFATVNMVVWKLCEKGPEPDEYRPFILAKPDGADVEVPNSDVFARLFRLGWKVVSYESSFHNRLTWAADRPGFACGIPMWEEQGK